MDDLKKYVDNMFSKYKETNQIKELKYEVLSNLKAKLDDLLDSGMEYNEALQKSKDSISNIDNLIDYNVEIYINKYKLEYMQIVLLYLIIAWIITIPIKIIGAGTILNGFFFVFSTIVGIAYVLLNRKIKGCYCERKAFINLHSICKLRRIVWILWSIFIVVCTLFTTAIQFGSNIWFFNAINISGPYNFALIAIRYMLPFMSIIIPLIFNIAPKLILKYEVGENNEN